MSTIAIQRRRSLKDIFGLIGFVVAVALGTFLLNSFVFQSYNVEGRSMEDTLHDGDKIIVNRLPVTWSRVQNQTYLPKRNQIIVFENTSSRHSGKTVFLVKRVIGMPGETVRIKDGKITVSNAENPDGFNPDDNLTGASQRSPVYGDLETTVPEGHIYVVGDHRDGSGNSLDSRNGLGTVPLYQVIGPVKLRSWPISKMRAF